MGAEHNHQKELDEYKYMSVFSLCEHKIFLTSLLDKGFITKKDYDKEVELIDIVLKDKQ